MSPEIQQRINRLYTSQGFTLRKDWAEAFGGWSAVFTTRHSTAILFWDADKPDEFEQLEGKVVIVDLAG